MKEKEKEREKERERISRADNIAEGTKSKTYFESKNIQLTQFSSF